MNCLDAEMRICRLIMGGLSYIKVIMKGNYVYVPAGNAFEDCDFVADLMKG